MSKFMCGWVNREGVFFPCNEYEHGDLARKIEYEHHLNAIFDEQFHWLSGESLLDYIGYIKVAQSNFFKEHVKYDSGRIYYFSKYRMTKAQIEWLNDHIEDFSHEQLESLKMLMDKEISNG